MSATCRSCSAPILWVKTPAGKMMPLDAKPDPEGSVVIRDSLAVVLTAAQKADPILGAQRRWMAHWGTCPTAKSHKKAKQ